MPSAIAQQHEAPPHPRPRSLTAALAQCALDHTPISDFHLGVTGLSRTKTHCKRFSHRSQATGGNCGEMYLQMCLFDLQSVGHHARVLHLPAKQTCVSQSVTANHQRPAGFEQDIAISSPVRSPRALNQGLGSTGSFLRFWGGGLSAASASGGLQSSAGFCLPSSSLSLHLHGSRISLSFLLQAHALMLSENPSLQDDLISGPLTAVSPKTTFPSKVTFLE